MTLNDLKWCKTSKKAKHCGRTDRPTDRQTDGQSGLKSRVHAIKDKGRKKAKKGDCNKGYAQNDASVIGWTL